VRRSFLSRVPSAGGVCYRYALRRRQLGRIELEKLGMTEYVDVLGRNLMAVIGNQ